LHCAGHSTEALRECLAVITWLEDLVDGPNALIDVVARPQNAVAKQVVEVLGIFAASLRRAVLTPTAYEGLVAVGRALMAAYVGLYASTDRTPSLYPRSHAATIQWLYLLMTRRLPEDALLIETLYALEHEMRPAHKRSQATRHLRDFAYARYQGCSAEADAHRRLAVPAMSDAGLARQLRVIEAYGYLEYAAA